MRTPAHACAPQRFAVLICMDPNPLPAGLRLTDDGSVERADGTVAYFSAERFIAEICKSGHCFACGRAPGVTPFNDEHVIPRWLLRRHGLFEQHILLPNLAPISYRNYTVPCCTSCNSLLGATVEEPVSALLQSGYDAVRAHLLTNGPWLLFAWLAFIFLKTHLKDGQLRWHLDRRLGETKIADFHEWDGLHHLHCLARTLLQPTAMTAGVLGSFLCTQPRTDEGADFDYGDLLGPKTALLRTGDVALLCVFDDSGASRLFADPLFSRIDQPPSMLQLREMAAHFAFLNVCLRDRPSFHTSFLNSGEHLIHATLPDAPVLEPAPDSEFGKFLWRFCADPLRGTTEWKEIEEPVRQGRYTFLVDSRGAPLRAKQ